MRTVAASATLALVCLGAPGTGRAQLAPPPAERAQVYSPYEAETIDEVLHSLGASIDPRPEGKIVERIDVVPLEVFEERDVLPRFLNVFHATTRPSVVRREMLLREGERYSQALCDDTLRNLRHLIQLSVVLVVAAAGTDEGRVRVVVITKDVWSLRANWDLVVDSGGLESFQLEPDERNVAGLHHVANASLFVDPATVTLGVGYQIPRIDGSRVAVSAEPYVVVNKSSGSLEGSGASLVAGQPLYSGLADWSWDASVAYWDYVTRSFVNAAPKVYKDPRTGVTVPFEYRSRFFGAVYEATRSLGWEVKHDFTFGADASDAGYRTVFTAVDPVTTADFEASFVPTSNARIGPFVQYHSYAKRYVRLLDFESLALQEDASLGHDVVLRAFPSFRALGASYDSVSIYAAAQYSVALRDGFFRAALSSTTIPQPGRLGNAAISPSAHLVTPSIAGLGRLVVDGTMLYRWRDDLNIQGACPGLSIYGQFTECASFLGGSNRLRGFPTNYFTGKDFVAYNVELRSRPVELLSLELGGTLFFDAGGAAQGLGNLQPVQSVGVGFRAVFPWLDREVFRADIGFPLERPIDATTGAAVPPFGFVITFGQAFDVPSVARPSILPTGQSSW